MTFVMLLGLGCVPVSAAVTTDGYGEVVFENNFDTQKWGSMDGPYRDGSNPQPSIVESPVDKEHHHYVAKMPGLNSDTGKSQQQFLRNLPTLVNPNHKKSCLPDDEAKKYKKMKISADVMFETNFSALELKYTGEKDGGAVQSGTVLKTYSTGIILDADGNEVAKYQLDTWYTMTAYLDFETHTYKGYLDGKLLTTGTIPNTIHYGVAIRLDKSEGGQTAEHCVYADNMLVAIASAPELDSVSPTNQSNGFPVENGEAVFSFSNPLNKDITPTVTMQDGSGNTIATSVTVSDYDVTVKNTETLDFDTDYTITVGTDVTDINGKTSSKENTLAIHTMKEQSYGSPITYDAEEQKASITVTNPTTKKFSAALIVAEYDAEGNLTVHTIDKQDVTAGDTADLSEAVGDVEGKTIYVYAADGDTLSKPLYPKAIKITADGTEELGAYDPVTVDSATLTIDDDGKITVAGQVSPTRKSLVYINVIGPESSDDDVTPSVVSEGEETEENEAIAATESGTDVQVTATASTTTKQTVLLPYETNDDGSFTYEYTPEDFTDGEYTVSVGAWGAETVSDNFYCLRPEVKEKIVSAVNGAADAEKMEEALAPYRGLLKADDSCFCGNTYQTLWEQKSYSSVDDIIAMMEKAQSLLNKVKGTRWDMLSPVLTDTENAKILFKGDTTTIETFREADEDVRNTICSYMTDDMPFATFVDLRTSLKNAITSYRADQAQKEDPIESNNSYIGGTTGRPSTTNGTKSGGSSSLLYVGGAAEDLGTNDVNEIPPIIDVPTQGTEKEIFADMQANHWAFECVASLAEQGVVSGDDNGNFRPDDAITREEFVKLLVCALGIETDSTEMPFADVAENEWYAPYVAAAYAAGIITGNETGAFGVGQQITRQDMAVMVCRAAEAVGQTLEGGEVNFTDNDAIADYAKDAIGKMQKAGLLNGIGDGTFAPTESASRAQAAKVIAGLMTIIGK